MVVAIGWIIHKVCVCVCVCVCEQSNMNNQRQTSHFSEHLFHLQKKNYVAEGKIMIIAIYFIIFLIVTLIKDAVYVSGRAAFEDALNSYFACEAVGYVPGKCDRDSFEHFSYPLLSTHIAFYITNLFMAAVVLLYLINCGCLIERFKKRCCYMLKAVSTRPSTNFTTNTEMSNK